MTGEGTKKLVISYKDGSDFDLVLQKLQSDSRASKSNKGVSKLIRDLVVATHGCKIFRNHSEVDSPMFEQFCLEALGLVSGYREIVKGYLSLQGAVVTEDSEIGTDRDNEDRNFENKSTEDKSPSFKQKNNFADSFIF